MDGIRSIDPEVCKLYGIQIQTDKDDNPIRYAYKYPHTVKYRDYNDKSKSWIKDRGVGMNELFGPEFNQGSSHRIYITEGEFDAASLYQILRQKFPVKSLPSASIGEKFIKNNFNYLNAFKEVIYAGELDEAGRRAAESFMRHCQKSFTMYQCLSTKMLTSFLKQMTLNSLLGSSKATEILTRKLLCSDEEVEQAILTESPYDYIPTGHSGLDDKIRGVVKGGLTFIKAPRGTGKTEVVRY